MIHAVERAIKNIAECDPTITPEQIRDGLDVFAGRITRSSKAKPVKPVYTRKECAEILKVSSACVTNYIRAGLLVPVKPKGMSRAIGVTEESLRDLAEGRKNDPNFRSEIYRRKEYDPQIAQMLASVHRMVEELSVALQMENHLVGEILTSLGYEDKHERVTLDQVYRQIAELGQRIKRA